MRSAVIVSTARTPIGRAYRGGFNNLPSPTLASHSIKAMALALFGACLASTTPETFTWVPPPSKVGEMTFVASAHACWAGFLVISDQ